ncbi:MAG TPA: 4Fe-4S binding protein [Armatimonadota bacterium]|jgi:electron transport complex protein RnfB
MADRAQPETNGRRNFLANAGRGLGLLALGGSLGALTAHATREKERWQIDPHKCTACGLCASACVLHPSAVKVVHAYAMCGYCQLCTGFFEPGASALNTGAENQQCPTDAIKRSYIEDPYYEYTIDEKRCIGCAKCVRGCGDYGNGSLFLQIRHDHCVNCNQCAIATICPAHAVQRVPAAQPYIIKKPEDE